MRNLGRTVCADHREVCRWRTIRKSENEGWQEICRRQEIWDNSHLFHSPTLTNSHQVRPKSAPANPDLGLTWHLLSVIYCLLFVIVLFINYYYLLFYRGDAIFVM